MAWGMFTACAGCGEMRYCHGKSRDRMICLDCFAEDETLAKLRRTGTAGKRRRYRYRRRRPKAGMVEAVRKMREEGMVVGAIADAVGVSEKTVRNYLSMSRKAEKGPPTPDPVRVPVPRKEELDQGYVPVSGEP
jgi:hypothetical protein